MIGTPPFKMIMRSLHHREKPITPRMIDTMPLISKVIAKPPDIPGIPGDAPGNPSWGKSSPAWKPFAADRGECTR
ncbi:MAG: hypothetical protein CO013_08515 [Syntrophobacterales bacterium CG_4_8_14_3_um_filter_58_8]|nr:MAG: hypothetical protein CO013_08515 [Syntrophobacterales bacterium CG_4_8_14_3_um_filter_58_8]